MSSQGGQNRERGENNCQGKDEVVRWKREKVRELVSGNI